MYSYDRSKHATVTGPLREQLSKHWNTLHDIEDGLSDAAMAYDSAASYPGEGDDEARKIVQEIRRVQNIINRLAKVEFDKLSDLEESFLKKHGSPEEYQRRMQDAMGLR